MRATIPEETSVTVWRFEVITPLLVFWAKCRVDLKVDSNISEEHDYFRLQGALQYLKKHQLYTLLKRTATALGE
jgi:hypothetical protein